MRCPHAFDSQVLLSVTACGIYVYETYGHQSNADIDFIFGGLFFVDFALRLFAAQRRLRHILSAEALVDLLTILPVFLRATATQSLGSSLNFLRFSQILRIMRILRAFKLINNRLSAVARSTLQLALTVTSIVFLSAGLVHLFEQELYETFALHDEERSEQLTFGGSMWFIVVTLSTVGYGDVVPETWLGQAVTAAFTIGAIVLIPMQVNRLTGLLALQSKFRTSVPRGDSADRHLLLVGYVSDSVFLDQFLSEFYHPDRISDDINPDGIPNIVIMGPEEPTDDVQTLLLHTKYEQRVSYVRGSVMQRADLFRVAADKAEACFILCNAASESQITEDRATAVRTLVVKNFNPDLKVFVHVLGGEALHQVQQSEVNEAVSIREWKSRLMAQNCLTIGFSTLVHNLLKSATVPDLDSLEPWVREYTSGAGLEIYSIQVPVFLDGRSFADIARLIYDTFRGEAIVWGVQEQSLDRTTQQAVNRINNIQKRARRASGPSSILLSCSPYSSKSLPGRVYLNPGQDFKVKKSMFLFVLAEDESIALNVANLSLYDSGDIPAPIAGGEGFSARVGEFDRASRGVGGARWMWSDSDSVQSAESVSPKQSSKKGWSLLKKRVNLSPTAAYTDSSPVELRDPRLKAVLSALRFQKQLPAAAEEQMNFSSVLKGICIRDISELDTPVVSHIVYIGSLDSFADFLKPLRSAHLLQSHLWKPIVILTEDRDHASLERFLSRVHTLQDIYIVFGRPQSLVDLQRAGLSSADCAVLSSGEEHTSVVDGSSLDSSVLFNYLVLEQALLSIDTSDHFFVCVELSSMANLQILNSKRLTRMALLKSTTPHTHYTSNTSISSFSVDGLSSQQRGTNREASMGLSAWCKRLSDPQAPVRQDETTLPFFAAGFGFASNSLHTILCQAYFAPETMRFADELLSPDPGAASRLMVEPVNFSYHGKRFGQLFHDMLTHLGIVVVGLYRCRSALGSPLCYVYTGPDPQTVLYSTEADRDMMYILSTRPLPQEDLAHKHQAQTQPSLPSSPSSVRGVSRGFASPWNGRPAGSPRPAQAASSPLQQVTRMSAILGFTDSTASYQASNSGAGTPLASFKSGTLTKQLSARAPPPAAKTLQEKKKATIPTKSRPSVDVSHPAAESPQAVAKAAQPPSKTRVLFAAVKAASSMQAVQLELQRSPPKQARSK